MSVVVLILLMKATFWLKLQDIVYIKRKHKTQAFLQY